MQNKISEKKRQSHSRAKWLCLVLTVAVASLTLRTAVTVGQSSGGTATSSLSASAQAENIDNNVYRILQGGDSDQCLYVTDAASSPAIAVQNEADASQTFYFVKTISGFYRIFSACTWLDFTANQSTQSVEQSEYIAGDATQLWEINYASRNLYYIKNAEGGYFALNDGILCLTEEAECAWQLYEVSE